MKTKFMVAILTAVFVSSFLTTAIIHDSHAQPPSPLTAPSGWTITGQELSVLWLNDGLQAEQDKRAASLSKLPKGGIAVSARAQRFQFTVEGQTYEIGFREDGVVVWKKTAAAR